MEKRRPILAAAVVVLSRGSVLLLKRREGNFSRWWECPGGAFEFGEGLAEAAARELREETGIRARKGDLAFAAFMESKSSKAHVVFAFFRTALGKRPKGIIHPEHSAAGGFPVGRLPGKTKPNNRRAIILALKERKGKR